MPCYCSCSTTPGLALLGLHFGQVRGRPLGVSFQRGLADISALLRERPAAWTRHFDNASGTPYLSQGAGLAMRQVWFDDPASIAAKVAIAGSLGVVLAGCWTGDALDYGAGAPLPASAYWGALLPRPSLQHL